MPGTLALSTGASVANDDSHIVNGHVAPTAPLSGLPLTEYSVNPSPPEEDKKARIKKIVPDDFILPTGHPDVCATIPCP